MGKGASLGPALLALIGLVSGGSGKTSESEDAVDAIAAPAERSASPVVTTDLIEGDETADDSPAAQLYRLAARLGRAGRGEEAGHALLEAVRAGFDDVSRLRRDRDLALIRHHPVYRAIVAARDAADPVLVRRRLAGWQADHGDGRYRYVHDPDAKLAIAAPLDESAVRTLRAGLERLETHLSATLFEDAGRHAILVVIPLPGDAATLLPEAAAHGVYRHRQRLLVAREPGRALRHEFVHALHHHHMDARGQEHPLWIQEGLAALYEEWRLDETEGIVEHPPNDRDAAVARLAAAGRLLPLSELVTLTPQRLRVEGRRAYPQLRSVFRYLAEHGHLETWYRHYVAHFDEDPSGIRALEAAGPGPLDAFEAAWRQWVGAEGPDVYTDQRP
jgi:hypothetical protein